jgi:hypothetical protein
MRKSSFVHAFIATVLLLLVSTMPADAGYSRSSSSYSRPSSSSYSRPSSSYSRPASRPSAPSYSRPSSSSPPSPSRPAASRPMFDFSRPSSTSTTKYSSSSSLTAGDRAIQSRSRLAPSTFRTPREARTAFKLKYGSVYTSHFATQPAARPRWIPTTYTYGGHPYNVVWNPVTSAYGYYPQSGVFVTYDPFVDMAMANYLMQQQGGYAVDPSSVSDRAHRSSWRVWLIGLLVIGGAAVLCVMLVSEARY